MHFSEVEILESMVISIRLLCSWQGIVKPLRRWLDNRNVRAHSVTFMSNDSQNEVISLLENAVRKKMITEVKDAGMYVFSVDTNPDLS